MRKRITKLHPQAGGSGFNGELYTSKMIKFSDLVSDVKGALPNPIDPASGMEYDLEDIEAAVLNQDLNEMREISQYFYTNSGIYGSLVRYLSTLMNNDYRLDMRRLDKEEDLESVTEKYHEALSYLDSWNFKTQLPEIDFYVVRDGAFYGYLIETDIGTHLQRLPSGYCRSIYKSDGYPIVELDIKYFEDAYMDAEERKQVLRNYPQEIRKYYQRYENGSLESSGTEAWCPLDPTLATVFRFFDSDVPILFGSIKEIIRLSLNRAIEDKKSEQELFKILIQQMPLDKEYNLVFDIEEAKDMHANSLSMIQNAPGVDVLTTFAKTEAINLNDGLQSTTDGVKNATKGIYDESGISPNVMATEGNISLQFSVAKDEKLMYYMLKQKEKFINLRLFNLFSTPNKLLFSTHWLDTTQYNYKDKVAMYKEAATLGYSKLTPAIAMGESQSNFESNLDLENEVLDLNSMMKPLESSYAPVSKSEKKNGAPEKEDIDKEDSTLDNIDGKGGE